MAPNQELGMLVRLLAPLTRRVRLMVSRAVVTLVNDALKLQGVQLTLLAGETADDVERFQEYGFSSVPLPGAEAIALAVGASRSHLVVIAVDDRRYRKQGMGPGEVALYSKFGQTVQLKANGSIELTPAPGADVMVVGNLVATGAVQDAAGTMQEMRDFYNLHTHTSTAPGNPTSVPVPPMS